MVKLFDLVLQEGVGDVNKKYNKKKDEKLFSYKLKSLIFFPYLRRPKFRNNGQSMSGNRKEAYNRKQGFAFKH